MYEEMYIDEPENKTWFDQYCHDIPVIHINGRFLMKHFVDEKLLQTTLSSLRDTKA